MRNPEPESYPEIAEPVRHDFPARDAVRRAGVTIPFPREDEDDLEPTIVLGRE